jgi:hypothetical protein
MKRHFGTEWVWQRYEVDGFPRAFAVGNLNGDGAPNIAPLCGAKNSQSTVISNTAKLIHLVYRLPSVNLDQTLCFVLCHFNRVHIAC